MRSVLLQLLPVLFGTAPALGATLTRGPYLQLMTAEAVTVVWNTDVPAACALAIRQVGGATRVIRGSTGTVCAIAADGLRTGSRYAYTPRADDVPLGSESLFETHAPGDPFSFLVVGDSGSADAHQYAVADAMLATPADFIVHTGDMIYGSGEAEHFDPQFFVPYGDLLRRLVFWPCLGNHDIKTFNGDPWRAAFYTPANNAAGSEKYYSFDYGNAHVAVINSNVSTSPGSAQYTFLDQDLAASTATWKFVAFHHSIYASGSHGSNIAIQNNLVPLFDARGVDMVLMAHDHHFERTKPLRGGQVVEPGAGIVYLTTGGGGRSTRPVGTSSFTAYAESAFHFTRIAINDGALLAQMIRDDGQVRDSVTLVKGAPPPPPVCGDGLVNRPEEQCDGDDHPACRGACRADCRCVPFCGDDQVNLSSEQCDGTADAACPELCFSDCLCGDPSRIVDLVASGDTFIEAGSQSSWDHGAATRVDVDDEPADVAYLKFDLSDIGRGVDQATLTLRCTNSSPDGGTLYPVGNGGWIEGDRAGDDSTSASGPGLKWRDLDTNGDGTLDSRDASPFLPDFGQRVGTFGNVVSGQSYSVNVTPAFQGGPGVYSLAIRNGNPNGASFASREATSGSTRPRLRLKLSACVSDVVCDDGKYCNGRERCVTGRCEAGPPIVCNDGVSCTTDRCDEATRACARTPSDAACSNGVFCDGVERCDVQAGCRPGSSVACDDGIACTVDTCAEQTRSCAYTPTHARCDDQSTCTTDTCEAASGCRWVENGQCGTTLQFAPVADTYIESGAQAGWDHGIAAELDVDAAPADITYLKFNLSGVAGPITRARLTLYCTNDSPDGGTVHPVANSSWVEGNRTGQDDTSGSGPGLKWNDVDTNRDGKINSSDASPYVPDLSRIAGRVNHVMAGRAYTVDVSPAFNAGPTVYTIAIKNGDNDGTLYASREHATAGRRPILHVERSVARTTSTVTTSSTTSSTTTTVPQFILGVVDADVTVRADSPTQPFGTGPLLELDADTAKYTFVRVRASGVGTRQVTNAVLRLQVADTATADGPTGGRIHRVTACGWDEVAMTWNTKPAIDGPVLDELGPVARLATVELDVTAAVSGDGLYCFALETPDANGVAYNSREGSGAAPEFRLTVQP